MHYARCLIGITDCRQVNLGVHALRKQHGCADQGGRAKKRECHHPGIIFFLMNENEDSNIYNFIEYPTNAPLNMNRV